MKRHSCEVTTYSNDPDERPCPSNTTPVQKALRGLTDIVPKGINPEVNAPVQTPMPPGCFWISGSAQIINRSSKDVHVWMHVHLKIRSHRLLLPSAPTVFHVPARLVRLRSSIRLRKGHYGALAAWLFNMPKTCRSVGDARPPLLV